MKLFWFKYLKWLILLLLCIFTEQIYYKNMANNKLSPNSHTPSFGISPMKKFEKMDNNKLSRNLENLKYGISPLEKFIMDPTLYTDKLPHQHYPRTCVKMFNHWLKIPQEKAEIISELFDIITIVISHYDDLEDDGELRRGGKCAHRVFGVAHTLFSANYATLLTLTKVLELNHPDATRIFVEELKQLYLHDCTQMGWREAFEYPPEEEYCKVVKQKGLSYINIGVRLMQLFSTCKFDFSYLVDQMGLRIFILDDYVNLTNEDYHKYQGYCKDLDEGKCTYPILHAFTHGDRDEVNRFKKLIREKSLDDETKAELLKFIKNTGSLEYSKRKVDEITTNIYKEVQKFGGNPYFQDYTEVYKF